MEMRERGVRAGGEEKGTGLIPSLRTAGTAGLMRA